MFFNETSPLASIAIHALRETAAGKITVKQTYVTPIIANYKPKNTYVDIGLAKRELKELQKLLIKHPSKTDIKLKIMTLQKDIKTATKAKRTL